MTARALPHLPFPCWPQRAEPAGHFREAGAASRLPRSRQRGRSADACKPARFAPPPLWGSSCTAVHGTVPISGPTARTRHTPHRGFLAPLQSHRASGQQDSPITQGRWKLLEGMGSGGLVLACRSAGKGVCVFKSPKGERDRKVSLQLQRINHGVLVPGTGW